MIDMPDRAGGQVASLRGVLSDCASMSPIFVLALDGILHDLTFLVHDMDLSSLRPDVDLVLSVIDMPHVDGI